MLTNYLEFLAESAVAMICESQVHYSPRLRGLLKSIESPVASALLEIELQDLDVASNYLDMGENKDQLTFIPDKKAKELEKDARHEFTGGSALTHNMAENGPIFGLLGYVPQEGGHNTPSAGQEVTVLSRATSPTSGRVYAMVSFHDPEEGRELRSVVRDEYLRPSADYYKMHRQPVRTGRLVRAMLAAAGKKFTDQEVADFVNRYKSEVEKLGDVFSRFRVVRGVEIAKRYQFFNYIHGRAKGTIGNSCMAASPESYFDIYVENPDKCGLLVLASESDPSKISARALVWSLDQPEGVTFVDRVYYTEEQEQQLFRDYARKQGWHIKLENNSSPSSLSIAPDGKHVDLGEIKVRIKAVEYREYPYVDTLKFMSERKGYCLLSTDQVGAEYVLESTGGYRNPTPCEMCGGEGRLDCPDCEGTGEVDCIMCGGSAKLDCRRCSAEGILDDETCPDCSGEGNVECGECTRGSMGCGNCGGGGRVDCYECG